MNDSKLYENSFDKPHYRSIDSQISEYAVQKSVIMDNDFKSKSDYESGNSVLNNLQFTSKNNKGGEEFTSNKKDGYINYLWRRGNENNRDSQKIIDDSSKKNLMNELQQFNENGTNNKINLSSMLSNVSNIKSNNNKNNNNNNTNNNKSNNTNKTDDMLSRNSADEDISYLCSNNNTNISNLDVGITANEIERFRVKYKQNSESDNSKFNVDSNNLKSDINTNQSQSEFNIYSNNNKNPSGDISGNIIYLLIFSCKICIPKINETVLQRRI